MKLNNLRPLRHSLPLLRPYRTRLAIALFCLVMAAASTLAMPVAIRYVLDYGFTENSNTSINVYFASLMLLTASMALFSSLRHYFVMWLGERVVADIRTAVYRHVLRMGPEFFEVTRTGEVLSRLTTDTTLVQSVVGAGMSIALRSLFMLLGGVLMLFITSPRLTLLLFILLPVVVAPLLVYGKKVRRLSRITQDRVADSSGIADEVLNAIQVIQAFTQEELQGRRFSESVESSFAAARRRLLVSSILSGIIVFTAFSAIVIVLWTAAHAVTEGSMSFGTLGQFLIYATIVAGSTTALGEVWGDVQRASGAMERLNELLHTAPAITDNGSAGVLPERFASTIGFSGISFNYPSRPQQPALDNFSLQVNPGETVALAGPSGAGKSTVFQLLLRFYDPREGTITLSGVDIRDYRLSVLRKKIGIVPQHTVLFAGSVLDNIRMGRPDAGEGDIREAAIAARAADFINTLPDGYETQLGEKGARLSGGQQQRIAIARAILKDPPVLLLDEATSSLDAESENLVQQALTRLMQDRTVLVIAHRLATVKKADRIIVMDHGRIIDQGRHEELVAAGGLYTRLAELQLD